MIAIRGTILCSGNLVQDTIVAPADQIVFGGTKWVDQLERHLGGNAANSSYAIGILGGRVRILGWIGADAAGSEIRTRLESVNVDTSHLQTGVEPTSASVALVKSDGARAFLHRPGASREAFANFSGFDAPVTNGCSHYHLANPFSLPHFRGRSSLALQSARDLGFTTSLDTAWDSRGEWMQILAPCLPLTDLLFANEDEIRLLTGHSDPAEAVRVFRDHGAQHIVVKLGARGCMVFPSNEEAFIDPAHTVPVVDTTGAGDCFVGAFLAALQRGSSTREAAQLANAAGASSVAAYGGTTGLKPYAETLSSLPPVKLS